MKRNCKKVQIYYNPDSAGKHIGAGDVVREHKPMCAFCFSSTPVLFSPGCACRSDDGRDEKIRHVHCAVRAITFHVESMLDAAIRQDRLDQLPEGTFAHAWAYCRICKQAFTGEFALELARSFIAWSRAIDDDLHVSARVLYATLLYKNGKYDECTSTLLPLQTEFISNENHIVTDALLTCCEVESGISVGVETRLRQIHTDARERLGDESPVTLVVAQSLSVALFKLGRLEESLPIAQLVHSTRRRVHGDDDPVTLKSGHHLGSVLFAVGRHADADTLLTDVYTRTNRTFGPHNLKTLSVLDALSDLVHVKRRFDEAEDMRRRIYDGLRLVFPADHSECIEARLKLAMTLHAQDKLSECMLVLTECGALARFADIVAEMRTRAAHAFPIGTRVTVRSMCSSPQYNNANGTVIRFDSRKVRYGIRLASGKMISIKFESVVLFVEPSVKPGLSKS